MKCPHCQREFEHPGWELEEVLRVAARPTVGLRAADAQAWFDHYASVGFVDGSGRKIVALEPALRKWKAAQPSHGRKYEEERAPAAASVFALTKQKEILEGRMQPLKSRFEHLSDRQRKEFADLKAQVRALDDQILRASR